MKRVSWGVVSLLVLVSTASAAGWRELTGSAAPEISADQWMNVGEGKPSLKSLEGRVWLLCFFGAHCPRCEAKTEALQGLHKKYYGEGFRVVCILDESAAEIRKMLPEADGNVWVGVDSRQSTLQRYATEGSLPLPRFYLVDADGKVVSQDVPAPAEIERLLQGVFVPALGRRLAPALDAARAAYEGGRPGEAWRVAEPFAQGEDAATAADARFLREKVERYAAWQQSQIERRIEKGAVESAMGELCLAEFRFPPLPIARWASERIVELEKDEKVRADRFAWKKLRAALAKEAKAGGSKSALQSTAAAYKAIRSGHADSPAAAIAKERLAALGLE